MSLPSIFELIRLDAQTVGFALELGMAMPLTKEQISSLIGSLIASDEQPVAGPYSFNVDGIWEREICTCGHKRLRHLEFMDVKAKDCSERDCHCARFNLSRVLPIDDVGS